MIGEKVTFTGLGSASAYCPIQKCMVEILSITWLELEQTLCAMSASKKERHLCRFTMHPCTEL